MIKSQILKLILDTVAECCEMGSEQICSASRVTEVIYARTLFVWYCNDYGICINDIARFLSRKRTATIYTYLANYHTFKQASITFRLISRHISEKLAVTLRKD